MSSFNTPVEIKIDNFFREIAKEMGLPFEQVEEVYRHYRRKMEQEMKEKSLFNLYKFGRYQVKPIEATNAWKEFVKNELSIAMCEEKSDFQKRIEVHSKLLSKEIENKLKTISQNEKHKTVYQRFQEHTSDFRRDYQLWLEERARGSNQPFEDTGLQRVSKKLKLR